jgi:glycerol-3-phosphate acyltransferase PlsX
LKGVVVKSHGSADITGFMHALMKANAEVVGDVLSKIAREIASMPVQAEPVAAEPNAG